MCGIAGIFRFKDQDDDQDLVRAMLGQLRARGPDGEGLCRDGPLTLGHRRLAVLDLSDAGAQPMRSASGRFLISFNGEVYNFRELREPLGLTARDLRSNSDTEVLLLAWERWGPGALARMIGQWAFALYDRQERRLWLVRDRFGEKPLFYHRTGSALTFASTIPALLKVPWVSRELDPEALAEYLALRYVVGPRTVLSGVRKLPGGHLLTAGPEGVRVRRWYDPRFSHHLLDTTRARTRSDLVDEFGALLVQAARRCLVSDVPVALLLSDGIDSNSIRSALALAGRDVPCVTYRMVGADRCEETRRAAAGDDRLSDVLVTPQDRLVSLVPAFSGFTEPVGDGAALATWILIRRARSRATVFLSGSGGDEVLGGYRLDQDRLRLAAIRLFSWLPAGLLERVISRHTSGWEAPATRLLALRLVSPRRLPAVARYLVNRPLPQGDVSRLFFPGAAPGRYLKAVDRLYQECQDGASDLDRIQEVMLRSFLTENILSHADSVAMASSAELRLPYLDRDLVDFLLRLPPALRVARWPGRARTKVILHEWGDARLRKNGVHRRKRTFNYGSIRELLATGGRQIRDRVVGSRPLRRALPGLEAWVDQSPDTFHGPREGTLWALLTLAIWCEAAGLS